MKNLFATAASVLVLGFAVPAMAQSSSSGVGQTGYYNSATVNQIGTGATNASSISQTNYDLYQYGNGATVIQNGTNVLENTSNITQSGTVNSATVRQGGDGSEPGNDHNTSSIGQTGHGNIADVMQGDLSTYNESGISQNGTDNWAQVKQGGVLGINDGPNLSSISQNGFSNGASVEQGGDSINTSGIYQADAGFGGDNWASVKQGGASGVINNSSVSQVGYQNSIAVHQH